MRRSLALAVASFALAFQLATPSQAASLRVAPVVLDLRAPTAASTIRIWNDARRPINVQIRVFRWVQRNGEDAYERTSEVVASPPMTTLRPGGENLVRIVRTSKRPVDGEESYRLVVDELPEPSRRKAGTVALVVRHSIPVFFANPDAPGADPLWTVEPRQGGVVVTVRNSGTMRLKVSNLSVNSGGAAVARREGLVGYVLGNSSASWFVPGTGRGRLSGRSVKITADSEAGGFDATARLRGG
ncbi:molecular chaperone [Sinorhizobium meliloti]|uniref:fimbrial biogenesis chaperone n=1 Tax=Sinorhizobium TaxID=28105 RepID=UPI0002F22679|nr:MULTISPECIES: molecular chaperone [Sinorhizobium]ARS66240.1 pilus assembly protein [Sinorhizobium meliloti RU11/001]MDE3765497.1 molecular chaperone [Sinorhizobium meliloti]MDE3779277.1 molecular chaperone [Sinorhizobium meliloti]MDE3804884.1 molecular chaperone [Sinorhizobium meliloti]MDE3806337.1 molecular chaperone [Sinorhizobium meliloti]